MLIRLFFTFVSLVMAWTVHAADEFSVPVADQEISVTRYTAEGSRLMIWAMPRLADSDKVVELASRVAEKGVEVWLVDLAESLFMPQGPATQRSIHGRYVAGLVETAHQKTGKNITLMSRGYASIPVLHGAREWQLMQQANNKQSEYFTGLILFSPDLYATIPSLGLPPIYMPVTSATSVPIMLYQSGKRGNRWQLDKLLEHLQNGGAQVYTKVMPGVTGLLHDDDKAPETQTAFVKLPDDLLRSIRLLEKTPTPLVAAALPEAEQQKGLGLDTQLKPFKGHPVPPALKLKDANEQLVQRKDYRGKITVMNFWATWCPPCVEEIPSLNNLRAQMAGLPFELISVNYAEDKHKVKKFLEDVRVDFPVLLDQDGSESAKWNVLVFPSTFVIDPNGKIVYGVNGAILWDSPEVVAGLKALVN